MKCWLEALPFELLQLLLPVELLQPLLLVELLQLLLPVELLQSLLSVELPRQTPAFYPLSCFSNMTEVAERVELLTRMNLEPIKLPRQPVSC